MKIGKIETQGVIDNWFMKRNFCRKAANTVLQQKSRRNAKCQQPLAQGSLKQNSA